MMALTVGYRQVVAGKIAHFNPGPPCVMSRASAFTDEANFVQQSGEISVMSQFISNPDVG
jgi:hypothetical protein